MPKSTSAQKPFSPAWSCAFSALNAGATASKTQTRRHLTTCTAVSRARKPSYGDTQLRHRRPRSSSKRSSANWKCWTSSSGRNRIKLANWPMDRTWFAKRSGSGKTHSLRVMSGSQTARWLCCSSRYRHLRWKYGRGNAGIGRYRTRSTIFKIRLRVNRTTLRSKMWILPKTSEYCRVSFCLS